MSTPGRDRINHPLSRRCVNCSLRLAPNFRRRQIEELVEPMLILLRSWVTPSPVSSDDILCVECFVLLQERTLSQTTLSQASPALGHLNICFACGMSIARARTRRVSIDCPQRVVILRWTPAHHVNHLEKVCRACWEAATRDLQSRPARGIKTPTLEVGNIDEIIKSDIADVVIPEPPPLPLTLPAPSSRELQLPKTQSKINSRKYKRVSASSRHCLFVACKNTERLLIPATIKEVLLLKHKIYIPLTARICRYHLNRNHFDELETPYSDFTGFQIDDMFTKLEKAIERQTSIK